MSGYFFKQTTLMVLGFAVAVLLADVFFGNLLATWRGATDLLMPAEVVVEGGEASEPEQAMENFVLSDTEAAAIDELSPYGRFRYAPAVHLAMGVLGLLTGGLIAALTGQPKSSGDA